MDYVGGGLGRKLMSATILARIRKSLSDKRLGLDKVVLYEYLSKRNVSYF